MKPVHPHEVLSRIYHAITVMEGAEKTPSRIYMNYYNFNRLRAYVEVRVPMRDAEAPAAALLFGVPVFLTEILPDEEVRIVPADYFSTPEPELFEAVNMLVDTICHTTRRAAVDVRITISAWMAVFGYTWQNAYTILDGELHTACIATRGSGRPVEWVFAFDEIPGQ